MIPYVQTQLVDAGLSGLLALGAWWLSGLFFRRSPRMTPRLALLLVLVVPAAVLVWKVFVEHVGLRVNRGSFAIALAFYAGTLWFPLYALIATFARRPRPPDARWVVALAIGAPSVAVWVLLVEPNRLGVREERIAVPHWPAGAALRVVHLSDLQTVGGDTPREGRALELVRALAPDLIVFTGDYGSGPWSDPEPAIAAARAFLAELDAPHGVVVVAGHSETEAVRERIFDGLDLVYLKNAEHAFDVRFADGGAGRVAVVGLEPWKPELAALARQKPADELRLVVSHVPDITCELDGLGVDLHFAGHTHGGQIVVPFFGAPITLSDMPRRTARGLFRWEDHWLNVCAGIGMEGGHMPRMRLFCPPEVCLVVFEGTGGG